MEANASRDGVAFLRLPHATGWNGAVWSGAWSVRAGDREATVSIPEQDPLVGRATATALATVAAR